MTAPDNFEYQTPATCEDAVEITGFFGRWGRRVSIAPSVAPSIASTAATSITHALCGNSCGRCEELKMQSDINQSMLNECATGLKAKEAELKASKIMIKKLQAQLDEVNQSNIQLRLEQVRFDRKLQSKDKQLAEQTAASTLRANTCNEVTAQLIQQHKELADALNQKTELADAMYASHQQELAALNAKAEAKDQENVRLQGKTKEQKIECSKIESVANDKIAELIDNRLGQDIEKQATERAAKFHSEHEKQFGDLLAKLHARVEELEAENTKLYAQLSAEDDFDVALDEAEEVENTDEAASH